MSWYPALVFLHVSGAAAVFASAGVSVVALRGLQRAETVHEARRWLALAADPGRAVRDVGLLLVVATGGAMLVVRWGLQPWMVAALVGIVGVEASSDVLSRTAAARLQASLDSDPPGTNWQPLASGTQLRLAVWLPIGILLGVIGLMTVKPGTGGSAAILAAGAALGGLAAASTEVPSRRG